MAEAAPVKQPKRKARRADRQVNEVASLAPKEKARAQKDASVEEAEPIAAAPSPAAKESAVEEAAAIESEPDFVDEDTSVAVIPMEEEPVVEEVAGIEPEPEAEPRRRPHIVIDPAHIARYFFPPEEFNSEAVPEAEGAPVEEEPPIEEVASIAPEPEAEDAAVEEIAAIELEPVAEESPIEEVASISPEMPPQDAPLEQGYYVQIGSYLDGENVKQLMDSYSGKYPLAFVDAPGATGPNATKRALVGRLSPDETGAVLEFFRSEGFKDAFVFVVN